MNVQAAMRNIRLIPRERCCLLLQKRFKYKKKWAVNLPSKTACEHALEHFDAFYKPLFGIQWPRIRVALLSLPKYAAIINSASDADETVRSLTELGAYDLIQDAARVALKQGMHKEQKTGNESSVSENMNGGSGEVSEVSLYSGGASHSILKPEGDNFLLKHGLVVNQKPSDFEVGENSGVESESKTNGQVSNAANYNQDRSESGHQDLKNVLPPGALNKTWDLEHFMPTQQVFSEKERLSNEEYMQSTYQEHPVSITIVPGQLPAFPPSLKVMAFPSGDVTDFPAPTADKGGLLNYYLLDAGSILPVIALDLRPRDTVLDLCAAPGGKSLAILQIMMSQGGHLVSNDNSHSRLNRLRTVLRSYLMHDLQDEFVSVVQKHGLAYSQPLYTKVLVDVPCNSDRHVLTSEDNNLFKPGRINDRLQMTTLQKDLLIAGIKSCKAGGSVVYSTCTLAAVQNDGVVQRAVEELWETTDINVVVEDPSLMRTAFTSVFNFHSRTRLGLQVYPSLTSNFGPTYFCKLRRLQ